MTLPKVTCQLLMGGGEKLYDQIIANAPFAKQLVRKDSHTGKTVVICGAGPSLAEHLEWIQKTPAHQVWACNSALPYLMDHHLPVSHGITVDQNIEMLGPNEWQRTFPVTYLVASSIIPELRQHLLTAKRKLVWFHNYLGIPDPDGWHPDPLWKSECGYSYEMWLYQSKYPPTVQVGYGLNTVPRAVCLALWMGFKKVYVVGADSAAAPDGPPMPLPGTPEYQEWLHQIPLYADGRTVADAYGETAIMAEGRINGRRWHTRTDMLITAKHLLDLDLLYATMPNDYERWSTANVYPPTFANRRVELLGDTLPNALRDQTPDFYEKLPRLVGGGQVEGFGLHPQAEAQWQATLDNQPEGVA